MCLIAHRYLSKRGRGVNIPNEVIDLNLRTNPHGFGIAWRDPKDGLVYQKFGPEDAKAFRKLLKSIDAQKSVEYVAHWRWATQGDKCVEMSHPFEYEDPEAGRVLVFHNGVISTNDEMPGESDTAAFVRRVMTKLPSRWWNEPGIVELVSDYIGWSRIAVMTEEEVVYVNGPREKWVEEGGINYSTEPLLYSYTKTWDKWEEDEKEEERLLASASKAYTFNADEEITLNTVWWHMGHSVNPVAVDSDDRFQDEPWGSVYCADCDADGQFYVFDHKLYIDIKHFDLVSAEEVLANKDTGYRHPADGSPCFSPESCAFGGSVPLQIPAKTGTVSINGGGPIAVVH